MNKNKELIKNTAIISLGKICTQLVSFLLLPLYTSILTTSEYGVVDLVITYSTLLLPFVTLALEQALFRFLIDARSNDELVQKYISTAIFTSFSITLIVEVIITIVFFLCDNSLLIYFGIVLFAGMISAVALQATRGLGDNVGYTLGSTISAIVHVILNVFFLVVLGMGPTGMMLATAIGNVCCALIICARTKLIKYIRPKYCNLVTFKELTRYSLPLIPNQLSWWALNASDKIIVQFFIGVAGNGLIAVANKFSTVYISFSNIFNISWTESVALHINDDDAEEFISSTINSVYRLFLSACCGIIVCMPFVFPIMVNSQYNQAYGLIPIFMLASLFNAIVSLYGVIYVAHKKTVEIAKTALYAAMLNIVSHLLLIRFAGIYAAALSTMIGYGGMATYRYFHSRKYIVIKFSNTTLLLSTIMLITSLGAYYSGNSIFQISVFILIVIMCFIVNKQIIGSMINVVIRKIGGK